MSSFSVDDLKVSNASLSEEEKRLQEEISSLYQMKESDILSQFGDLRLPRLPRSKDLPIGGSLTLAKKWFSLATAKIRAYYLYRLGASLLTFFLTSIAIPSLFLHMRIADLKKSVSLLFFSFILTIQYALLSLFVDPILFLYRKWMRSEKIGLLIIDPQLDFFPPKDSLILENGENYLFSGGTLPLQGDDHGIAIEEGAWSILPKINAVQEIISQKGGVIIASFDNHPLTHGATEPLLRTTKTLTTLNGEKQFPWPVHCVQRSRGWRFAPGLHTNKIQHVIGKGEDVKVDSYSAFYDNCGSNQTLLEELLKEVHGVKKLYIVGFAFSFCVGHTALDAQRLKFDTTIITSATGSTTDVFLPNELGELEEANSLMRKKLQLFGVKLEEAFI